MYLKYLIENNDFNNSYHYFHLLIVKISSDVIVLQYQVQEKSSNFKN